MAHRGFTLVELAAVLTTIGILIIVAVPSYEHMVLRARAFEARTNVENIAHAQRLHHRDHGAYVACPRTPAEVPTGAGTLFDASAPGWSSLGVRIHGRVHYAYEVEVEGEHFRVVATGDLDADGVLSRYVLDGEDLVLTVENELE